MNDKQIREAKAAFEGICTALDDIGWRYEKNEEELRIKFGVSGDDLPMSITIFVDAERQLVRLTSVLPTNMPDDKRVEGAVASCEVNYKLADGSFDYDLSDGMLVFRMTNAYHESLMGSEVFRYMIEIAVHTIDKYNDMFFMLAKGLMTVTDFLKKLEE